MLDELTIEADASGDDECRMSISGHAHKRTKVASPTLPTQLVSPLFPPASMQLWMDTTAAIGTTPITGRVLGGDATLPSGVAYKWVGEGPGGSLNYSLIGRAKRQMAVNLRFEAPDTVQADLDDVDTVLKVRWRLNGPLIETVAGPLDYYHYIEIDFYAPVEALTWGDNEDTNTTVDLNFLSENNTALGASWSIKVQNDRTTL